MAGFRIPLGKEPDTCETPCKHRDCAATRKMLAARCPDCGEQFQGNDVVCTREHDGPLVHWHCLIASLPAAPKEVRAMVDRAIR